MESPQVKSNQRTRSYTYTQFITKQCLKTEKMRLHYEGHAVVTYNCILFLKILQNSQELQKEINN